MLTESQILYATIASNHNNKICKEALEKLKQFCEDGHNIWLCDENGNSFKLTPDTKYICLDIIEE